MKNLTILLSTALLITFPAHAEYVRKNVRPNFFMPAHELNRVEKLPPLPTIVQPTAMPEENIAEDESHIVIDESTPTEKIYINMLPVRLMEEEKPEVQENILPKNPQNFDSSLEQSSQYQKIKKDYAQDLKEIEKNGQAPENPLVKETLEKMNSEDKVWVDDHFGQAPTVF